MTDISIVVPGIRKDRFQALYDSITKSTKRSFELIIVGPYYPPGEMAKLRNFKFVSDFGTPVRASNIAADLAVGKYITWAADDAVYIENALDSLLNVIENKNVGILTCKYLEGITGEEKIKHPISYYMMNGSHWTASPIFSNDLPLFNVGIMELTTFKNLKGWDCNFEGTFYSHSDMAARAFFSNLKISFANTYLLDCDHFPGISHDHKPIHDAQTYSDINKFKLRYGSNIFTSEMYKDIENKIIQWKDSPSVWVRRFGE